MHQGRRVFAFTREGRRRDSGAGPRARGELGGRGRATREARDLDAAIIFAPAGELVPQALRGAAPRRRRSSAPGIHMSDIPSFPYEILWQERSVRSVANLTRADGEEFLRARAPQVPVRTEVQEYPLCEANHALDDLRTVGFAEPPYSRSAASLASTEA